MKRNATVRMSDSGASFCAATSAETSSVQGGFFGFAMVWAMQKANDYLTKLAMDALNDPDSIPIEPLT